MTHRLWHVHKHGFVRQSLSVVVITLCLLNSARAELPHEHDGPLPIADDLTLHEVVEQTYRYNPRLQLIEARMKHIDAELNSASSFWVKDPSFNVTHYSDSLYESDGLREWEFGLQLPIWLPGQKSARTNTVEQRRTVINSSVFALKLELAGIVREILWQIALNKNQLATAEKEWEVVKKLEQDVQRRVELGDLAQSDLLLAQQESLTKEAALYMAEQEFSHAQHRYDMITSLKKLPATFEEQAAEDISITTDHPLLYQSQEVVSENKFARDQVDLEKRGNPTLFISTRSERVLTGQSYDNAIGMNISIPLGLSAHTTKKLTAAEVNLSESKSAMELLYRELNIAVQDASRELDALQTQLEFALRQSELSEKNLEFARKSFALGETSLLELIRIQAQAFAVERNTQKKRLEVGLYTARLNQAKGIIP